MKRKRRWVRFLLAGLLLLLVGLVGLLWYLRSARVATLVSARLSQTLGAPVQVGQVHLSLFGRSTFQKVQVFEEKGEPTPWLTVEAGSLDLSAVDVLLGRTEPRQVSLRGVDVTLRFDRAGALLTRLPRLARPSPEAAPTRLPRMTVESGKVKLFQEGRRAFCVRGIQGNLEPPGDGYPFTGTIRDPNWGEWSVWGNYRPDSSSASLNLTTPRFNLARGQAALVPFVDPSVWKHVDAEGPIRMEIALAMPFDYRIKLEPLGATVYVADLDLDSRDTTGSITVASAQVQIAGATGIVAGGAGRLEGTLDFRTRVPRLAFRGEIRGARLEELPRKLAPPIKLGGAVDGRAEVTFLLGDQVQVFAEGEGVVRDGSVAGTPLAGPVPFQIHSPATLEAAIGLRDLDLAALAANLDLHLPVAVAGRGGVWASLAVPLDAPQDIRRWHAQGAVHMPQLAIAGTQLEHAATQFALSAGILRLWQTHAELPGQGRVEGAGSITLPEGDLAVQLRAASLPLSLLTRYVPDAPADLAGRLAGRVSLRVPLKKLDEPAAWSGQATLTLDAAQFAGWSADLVQTRLSAANGTLQVARLQARRGNVAANATGTLSLARPFTFNLDVAAEDADVSELARLVPGRKLDVELKGRATARGQVRGTLEPVRVEAAGTITSRALEIEAVALTELFADWKIGRQTLRLNALDFRVFGGGVSGEGVVPLDDNGPGGLALRFGVIDLRQLSQRLNLSPALFGTVNGTAEVRLGSRQKDPREWSASLDLSSARVFVAVGQGRLPLVNPTGSLVSRGGSYDLRLQAEIAGGGGEVEIQLPARRSQQQEEPSTAQEPWFISLWNVQERPPPPVQARLRLTRVQLGRLWEPLGLQAALGPLEGLLDLELNYSRAGKDSAAGSGRLQVVNLRWGSQELASGLRGELRLRGRILQIPELSGDLAGGILRAAGGIRFPQADRGWYVASVERGEAARLLLPFSESLAEAVKGSVDVTVRGSLGSEWQGGGRISLARGKILEIEVGDVRVPFDYVFAPGRGSAQIEIPEAGGQVGTGRVTGRLSLTTGLTTRAEGRILFQNVELRQALRGYADLGSTLGKGRTTGRFDFSGREMRSLNDLTGRLEANLSQTQALDLPVLRQVTPFLTGLSSATTFRSGLLKASLGNGVFRVHSLALENAAARLIAEGTVTLQGRLNLEVTARTRQLIAPPSLLRLVGTSVGQPLVGEALAQASTWLSNRVVHLRVTGTFRNPLVRVEPVSILTSEAIRFLLRTNLPLQEVPGVFSP